MLHVCDLWRLLCCQHLRLSRWYVNTMLDGKLMVDSASEWLDASSRAIQSADAVDLPFAVVVVGEIDVVLEVIAVVVPICKGGCARTSMLTVRATYTAQCTQVPRERELHALVLVRLFLSSVDHRSCRVSSRSRTFYSAGTLRATCNSLLWACWC